MTRRAVSVVKTGRLSLPVDDKLQVSLWLRLRIILEDRLSGCAVGSPKRVRATLEN